MVLNLKDAVAQHSRRKLCENNANDNFCLCVQRGFWKLSTLMEDILLANEDNKNMKIVAVSPQDRGVHRKNQIPSN